MENIIKKDDLVKAELFTASDEYVNMFVEWAIDCLKTALNRGKKTIILNVSKDFMAYVRLKTNWNFGYNYSCDEDVAKDIIDKGTEILKEHGYSSCSYLLTSDSDILCYELKEWTRGWTVVLSIEENVIDNLTKRIKRKLLWYNIRKWCFIVFIGCMISCVVMGLMIQCFQH